MSNAEQPARRTAVRAAIDRMAQGKPAIEPAMPPLTEDILKRLGHALLWRIVVEPYVPKQRGALVRAAQTIDAERILTQVGRIVLVGCFAWRSKTASGLDLSQEEHKPKVGDYVIHEAYAGTEIHLTTGHMLRVITETECLLVLNDPELIRAYL